MIILDEDAHQQPKLQPLLYGTTLRLPDPAVGRTPSPLPDYETSQAQQGHLVQVRKWPLSRRVDYRFCRATLWALAIYVGITVVVAVPFVALRFGRKSRWHPHSLPLPWGDTADQTSPQDRVILSVEDSALKCAWSNSDSNTSDASLQYTVSPTGSFFIRSNVTFDSDSDWYPSKRTTNGTFTVDINPNRTASDAVISLYLQSSSPDLRKRTHVCFESVNSTNQLFIYVPDIVTPHDFLNFTITLLLPSPTSSKYPLQVKKLVTYLPTFTQHISDLDQKVDFKQATIEGLLSKVVVDSINGRHILVKTSLAEIRGTFNVTESLTLDTIGAPIHANVTLVHEPNREAPTYLSLDTGNSAIETRITLHAPPLPSSHSILGYMPPPPLFLAHLKTFNAPLTASIFRSTETPSTTTRAIPLHLHAQNNMAPTMVTLDEGYEGTFDVKTKLAEAIVQESGSSNDNSKSGGLKDGEDIERERKYIYDHVSSTRTFGWVGRGKRPRPHVGSSSSSSSHSWGVGAGERWGGGAMDQGHVEIVSSLSEAVLKFGK